MGDDFDLFPKRENLDPFSFGKREKQPEKDKEDREEDLFGQEKPAPSPGPDLPPDPQPTLPTTAPPLPDLPSSEPVTAAPTPPGGPSGGPPPAGPSDAREAAMDSLDGMLGEQPPLEEKTFDEPVFQEGSPEETEGKRGRKPRKARKEKKEKPEKREKKGPSPFLVVAGALVIVIGILYGALTYLKRDKPVVPAVALPPVSVPVPTAKPVPAPGVPEDEGDGGQQSGDVKAQSGEVDMQAPDTKTEKAITEGTEVSTGEPEPESASGMPESATVSKAPQPAPAQPTEAAGSGGSYAVQVGAFILESSVVELENQVRKLGYEPVRKTGSTTAMMNMLTVGPFRSVGDGRAALEKLQGAGVETNLRRRNDGSAIINAGSYLLDENAASVMKKIRSLGFPVTNQKREARLPMTFVRVGPYDGMDSAGNARDEMKEKGLDAIVVKLQ